MIDWFTVGAVIVAFFIGLGIGMLYAWFNEQRVWLAGFKACWAAWHGSEPKEVKGQSSAVTLLENAMAKEEFTARTPGVTKK